MLHRLFELLVLGVCTIVGLWIVLPITVYFCSWSWHTPRAKILTILLKKGLDYNGFKKIEKQKQKEEEGLNSAPPG